MHMNSVMKLQNDGITDADYEYAKKLEKNLKEKVCVIIMI